MSGTEETDPTPEIGEADAPALTESAAQETAAQETATQETAAPETATQETATPEPAEEPPTPEAAPAAEEASPEPDAEALAAERAAALAALAAGAMAVTRVEPRRVDRRGGATVLLSGAGFAPGCRVRVGGEEVAAEVLDAFTLRFVAPAAEGTVPVEVRGDGDKSSTGEVTLDFARGPTLRGASPSEGPPEGGVEVTLEGEDFAPGCLISLFGIHAPEVQFVSSARLRFVLPALSEGPGEGAVTVTNPDGLSDRRESVFRYRPLVPELASVEPANGWVSGGKMLTARGKELHAKVRAFFGERPARVVFRSHTHVELEVPPSETTGAVDLTLENPDGKRASLAQAFTYEPVPAPPKIIDIFPREASTIGRVTVRVHGDNFTNDVRVQVGDVVCTREVLGPKIMDVVVPPRELPGPVSLSVTLGDVTIRQDDALVYVSPAAPKIAHLEPRTGPLAGGTKVLIEGEGFPPNAAVLFDGFLSKTVVVKGPTRIEAITPPSKRAAAVDVEVTSPKTGGGVAKAGFKYEAIPPPQITAVTPKRGTTDGGTDLGVEGKNFAEGVVVLVGGTPMKTRRISGSLLEAKTPEGQDGKLVDVAVKNPDGQQAIQKRAFQYDARYRS